LNLISYFHKCPHKFELTLLSAIKHSIKYKITQKSPVLNSTLENLGCPHMLQSLLRAQFTLPHLQTKQKEYLMTSCNYLTKQYLAQHSVHPF